MKVKAERGKLQSTPSFGYRVHMEPGQKSVLEVVPEEARKIQEAHHMLTSPDASLAEKNSVLRNITESIIFNRSTMALSITYRLIF